jgi:hypothetical protein
VAGRIRTIKPEMLEDKRTAALSDTAFRLFVAFILTADDYGNFRAEPLLITGTIYWATTPSHDVKKSFDDLVAAGLVTKYIVRGQLYGHLTGWEKHQRISHRGSPRVPGISEEDTSDIGNIGDTPETLANVSGDFPATLVPLSPISDHRSPITEHQDTSVPVNTPAQPTLVPLDPPRDEPREVWDRYVAGWRKRVGGSRPPVWDAKRRKLTLARLREFSVADLKLAVDGLWSSDWHFEKGFTSYELLLRDREHVEKFIDLIERPEANRASGVIPTQPRAKNGQYDWRKDLEAKRNARGEG